MCMCTCSVASVVSDSLSPYRLQLIRLLCPWDYLGKNTEVSCHVLLQGIKPAFLALQAYSFTAEPPEKPPKAYNHLFV